MQQVTAWRCLDLFVYLKYMLYVCGVILSGIEYQYKDIINMIL